MMDFLAMLQQYVDPVAVLVSIIFTQLLKVILPSPEGKGKWAVSPMINRFLPYLPILVAILTIIIKDVLICDGAKPMAYDDAVIKGIISGAMGAYLYRTAKVTVFGS